MSHEPAVGMSGAPPASDPDHLARETLRLLGPAPANWVPATAGIDHDVTIVGAGQNGVAIAFALRRAGIGRVSVIDAAAGSTDAGGWRRQARMPQLRTPKTLVGPELDWVGLGFRAWYEARHGVAAYQAFDRVPRLIWADYLDWFRTFVDVPVRYGVRLARIEPGSMPAGLRLHLQTPDGARIETTRKLILATGVSGSGRPALPGMLAGACGAGLASHTDDLIDFQALRGRDVAVLGAAASAFDAAEAALKAGARSVHLFARRPRLAATPVIRTRLYAGLHDNFFALPDALRWQLAVRYRRSGSTSPPDTVARVVAHPNFKLHLSAPWTDVRISGRRLELTATGQVLRFDHAIAGTGYVVDLAARPELAGIADQVLRWRDRYQPPPETRDDPLGESPYLGRALELQSRVPGAAPWLADIHLVNPGGFVSAGVPTGDLVGMRRDIPRVVARISEDLLLADLPQHLERMAVVPPDEFDPDLYRGSIVEPGC
jgi:cation diffusion facilitator CzcD-associated flavoprotein CzcO